MKIHLDTNCSTQLASKMITSALLQIFNKKSRINCHFYLLPVFKDTAATIDRYCQNIIAKGKIIPKNKPISFKAFCLIENSGIGNSWRPAHMTLRFGKGNINFYRFSYKINAKRQRYVPIREKR